VRHGCGVYRVIGEGNNIVDGESLSIANWLLTGRLSGSLSHGFASIELGACLAVALLVLILVAIVGMINGHESVLSRVISECEEYSPSADSVPVFDIANKEECLSARQFSDFRVSQFHDVVDSDLRRSVFPESFHCR
jgi:hypothetical protein